MKEDPRHIRISEFNYPLPDERIAKFPLSVRDQSKLLLYRHGEVSEDRFTSLPANLCHRLLQRGFDPMHIGRGSLCPGGRAGSARQEMNGPGSADFSDTYFSC